MRSGPKRCRAARFAPAHSEVCGLLSQNFGPLAGSLELSELPLLTLHAGQRLAFEIHPSTGSKETEAPVCNDTIRGRGS
jgi:hypothetical protein